MKHSSALILSNNDGDPDLTIPSLRTTLTASAKSRKNFGLFVFFDFRASSLTIFVTFFGFITRKCDMTFHIIDGGLAK